MSLPSEVTQNEGEAQTPALKDHRERRKQRRPRVRRWGKKVKNLRNQRKGDVKGTVPSVKDK